jgi:hypothetical protein
MAALVRRRAGAARDGEVRHSETVNSSLKRTEVENPTALAIRAFRRRTGRMGKEEREAYDRKIDQKSRPDLIEALNTPGRTEI